MSTLECWSTPDIFMAALSGIPARIMFLTLVRLRSWNSFLSSPAFLKAVFHASLKLLTLWPFLIKTYGHFGQSLSTMGSIACDLALTGKKVTLIDADLAGANIHMGLNDDVQYEGKTLHVQTEDLGARKSKVQTLVYMEGRILHSKSTGYEELGKAVKGAVSDRVLFQHSAIIEGIKAGKLKDKMTD